MRRDDPDAYVVEGLAAALPASPAVVREALAPLVTAARLARLEAVAASRTRSAVLVLEDLTDPHNGSAVLRSADAFGVQEVHVVERLQPFRAAHRVARGTHRWLDVVRHRDADACARALHDRGFRIFVAAMEGAIRPEALREPEKVAIVFGNEHAGVSGGMRAHADGTYAVPMVGFVESLNVSVAAAITVYEATRGRQGDLDAAAREALVARYLTTSVRDAERIVREHLASR